VSTVKKSHASIVAAWDFRNAPHIGPVFSSFDDTPSYEELTELVAALQLLTVNRAQPPNRNEPSLTGRGRQGT
jgi:hypothetical protein